MKPVPVTVFWVPKEEGGRSALPDGLKYSTVSKWPDEGWDPFAWSVVLEFDKSPREQGSPTSGRVRFLVENAPWKRLQPGRTFEIYEGSRKVADIKIEANARP